MDLSINLKIKKDQNWYSNPYSKTKSWNVFYLICYKIWKIKKTQI